MDDMEARQAALASLTELAGTLGLGDESLDEAVHDTFSREASGVNNGGVQSQIRCLIDRLGERGARAVIEEAAGE